MNKAEAIYLYLGQGTQFPQMGLQMIKRYPSFRETVRELDEVLQRLPKPPTWSIEGRKCGKWFMGISIDGSRNVDATCRDRPDESGLALSAPHNCYTNFNCQTFQNLGYFTFRDYWAFIW